MLAQAFLAEFENEAKITRRFLEQLPPDQLGWKPHEKSNTAGGLAFHIANVPGAIAQFVQEDTRPAPDFGKGMPQPSSKDEILAAHDRSADLVRQILPTYDDATMQKTFTATVGDKPAFAMPRGAFLRAIMLNHWIQHRGQFGVYLRLLGAKVPSSYGPSGDEGPQG